MELYQRIKLLAKTLAKSDKTLGEMLGLKQSTFSGYLKKSRQDNLWPLLPRILMLFPEVSRDWLYFGEGTMLEPDTAQREKEKSLSLQLSDIDEQVLVSVVETLEEVLQETKKTLEPRLKAEAVCKLYRLVRLDRTAQTRPATFLRYIREAMTNNEKQTRISW